MYPCLKLARPSLQSSTCSQPSSSFSFADPSARGSPAVKCFLFEQLRIFGAFLYCSWTIFDQWKIIISKSMAFDFNLPTRTHSSLQNLQAIVGRVNDNSFRFKDGFSQSSCLPSIHSLTALMRINFQALSKYFSRSFMASRFLLSFLSW